VTRSKRTFNQRPRRRSTAPGLPGINGHFRARVGRVASSLERVLRNRWRALLVTVGATVFTAVVGAIATQFVQGIMNGSEQPNEESVEPGTPCLSGGTGLTVVNHHSGMFINDRDRPRMGFARAETDVLVTYVEPTAAAPESCTVTFRGNSRENDGACLHKLDAGEVFWRSCGRDQADQRWSRERHWNDGKVWWERFHSARDANVCLQQASTGGVDTALAVAPCNSNWLQQWRVVRGR
jgi:hypothetical protein